MSPKLTVWHQVEINQGGRIYIASYCVENEILTVHFSGRRKATQLGSLPQDRLAKMLLRELVSGI